MSNKQIVKAKEYKVKDGDTLESIAASGGITMEELVKFNFGTADPHEVNKFLRSNVGSFKKTPDGKSFALTSKDDPGIIYIPEEFPEKSFPSSSSNAIVVKQIVKKTFKASKVAVQFRPKANWDGEFGFDWLRNGDNGETKYKDLLQGGYKSTDAAGKGLSYTKAEAYVQLKANFSTIDSEVKEFKKYLVPYLNLYPPSAKGNPAPPTSAELKILITVEDEEPLSIEFDYNKNLLQLDKLTLADKAIGAKREASDKTIKITCLEEFDSDQEIKVLAYPKTWKVNDPIPLAGKIIVGANSTPNRHHAKFVLVNVLTNINGVPNAGSFTGTDKKYLTNALYQALIYGSLEKGPDLDLSGDNNFKILTDARGVKTYGKFIYKNKGGADVNRDGGLFEDFPAEGMFIYLKTQFLKIAGNQKYKDYYTAFSFKESTYDPTGGQVQKIGVHNVVLFNNRKDTAFAHEVLHGLGLYHAHSDGGASVETDRKFFYTNSTTDNIMSYSAKRKSTWHWQWKIMRRSL
jgi:hypothetical protein